MGLSVFPAPATGISSSDLLTQSSWTLISSSQGNAGTITFSGISGYRKLRLMVIGGFSSTTTNLDARIRINGDSSAVYSHLNKILAGGAGAEFNGGMNGNDTGFTPGIMFVGSSIDSSRRNYIIFEVDNANNSERIKSSSTQNFFNSSGNATLITQLGFYRGNPAPITSLSIVTVDGTAVASHSSPAGIYLYGAN
jgi:hypothetical protein